MKLTRIIGLLAFAFLMTNLTVLFAAEHTPVLGQTNVPVSNSKFSNPTRCLVTGKTGSSYTVKPVTPIKQQKKLALPRFRVDDKVSVWNLPKMP